MSDTFIHPLQEYLTEFFYKPGWGFQLVHVANPFEQLTALLQQPLALSISVKTIDARFWPPKSEREQHIHNFSTPTPLDQITITHVFTLPDHGLVEYSANFDWEWWLINCIAKVEVHEAAEFFMHRGAKPFYPDHRPGKDPYRLQRVNER